jgi:DNA polymerase/3'-5' exonuclease PolX
MGKTKLPLAQAQQRAAELIEVLRPFCERIEVAGSVRREKSEVGDLEIVAISKVIIDYDLFQAPFGSHLAIDEGVAELIKRGGQFIKGKDMYRQIAFTDITLDLFLTGFEKWGMIYTIRTGSADFSHWLVTSCSLGGALPSHMKVQEGRLYRGGFRVDTPEEIDVFKTIGLDYIAPPQRIAGRWKR